MGQTLQNPAIVGHVRASAENWESFAPLCIFADPSGTYCVPVYCSALPLKARSASTRMAPHWRTDRRGRGVALLAPESTQRLAPVLHSWQFASIIEPKVYSPLV